jgi:hypothetical protein
MAAHLMVSLVVTEETDLEAIVEARCQPSPSGHIAALVLGGVTIQTTGDGARNMLALLDVARARVEAAHKAWLVEMATTAREES